MNGVDTMIIDKVNDILNSNSSNTTLVELCSYIKKNIHRIPQLNIDNISNISYVDNIIYLKNGSTCYIGPKYKNSLLEVIRYDSVS